MRGLTPAYHWNNPEQLPGLGKVGMWSIVINKKNCVEVVGLRWSLPVNMQNRGEAKEAARELIWDEGGGRQTGKFGTRFLNMESFSGYERNNVPEPQTAEHGGDGGSDTDLLCRKTDSETKFKVQYTRRAHGKRWVSGTIAKRVMKTSRLSWFVSKKFRNVQEARKINYNTHGLPPHLSFKKTTPPLSRIPCFPRFPLSD